MLDATPWPEVMDLLDYWRDSPPLHLLVKGYMGYEAKDPEEARPMSYEEMKAWAEQVNRG